MTDLFFDLDGTLIDSAEGIMRAYAYMMDALHMPYENYTAFRRVVGPPLYGCFREDGIPDALCDKALALFQEYYARQGVLENDVYQGIPDALSSLKAEGIRLYVATAKPELFAVKILDRLALSSFFTDVIGADMEEKTHEKSELLSMLFARNRLAPHGEMAMIGDRSYDIIGAHRAGIRAFGVLWGIGSEEELTEAGADLLLSTPASLHHLLRKESIWQKRL